jgi:hypothetical protein
VSYYYILVLRKLLYLCPAYYYTCGLILKKNKTLYGGVLEIVTAHVTDA